MKFKYLLITLFSISAMAAHVADRKIYLTDIITPGGTSIVKIPTSAMGTGAVAITNTDGELTTDPDFIWDVTNMKTTINNGSLGASTTADGLVLQNSTAATSTSLLHVSPALNFSGQGWNTTGSATIEQNARIWFQPTSTTSALSNGVLKFQPKVGASTYVDALSITGRDTTASAPKISHSGITELTYSNSGTVPGTTDHLKLINPGNNPILTSYSINGTVKQGTSMGTAGQWTFLSTASSSNYNFNTGSTIGSQSVSVQIVPSGLYSNGYLVASSFTTAGAANTSPHSVANVYGSYASKGQVLSANTVLPNTSTSASGSSQFYYCDVDASSFCSGTPTVGTCDSFSFANCASHVNIGCSQHTTGNCSDATDTDPSTCTGLDDTCSWEQLECSEFSGTDEGTCTTDHPGCSWEDPDCTGTYPAPDGTGTCNGGAFGTCIGTASCLPLGTSGSTCVDEAGCSIVTGMNVQLPSIAVNASYLNTGIFVGIKRLAGTGDVVIAPLSGTDDKFEDDSTSITLTTDNESKMFHPMAHSITCTIALYPSQETCEAVGCTWSPGVSCGDFSGNQGDCEANGCTYDTETDVCSGAGEPDNCSGSFVDSRKWYIW